MVIYGENLKKEFLLKYSAETAKTYMNDLKKIAKFENIIDKDLFNFTYEEIDEGLRSIKFKSYASIRRATSTYKEYTRWANSEGHVPTKINLWELFKGEKLKEYVWVHALENRYITREEMYNICDKLFNYTDKILIILFFEGIYGVDMKEARYLKHSDIDYNTGVVMLNKSKKYSRNIIIEHEKSLNIIKESDGEMTYIKNNGLANYHLASTDVFITPYVIRKTIIKKNYDEANKNEVVAKMTIESKLTRMFKGINFMSKGVVQEPFISGYSFLNATTIFKSGYFDYCLKLEKERGELKTMDYREACHRYGIKESLWNDYKSQYLDWKIRLNG